MSGSERPDPKGEVTVLCELTVNDRDRERLVERLKRARGSWSTYAPMLDSFRATLHEAKAVSPGEVPGDVITMNSRFSLKDLRRDETRVYTLVYPEAESPDEDKLCVLSPMGMALLGARVGDVLFLY